MQQSILTINAGSSSVKFALFELAEHISEKAAISGQIDGIGTAHVRLVAKDNTGTRIVDQALPAGADHATSFDQLLHWFSSSAKGGKIVAVGHRVVHGGERYSKPTLIDDTVLGHLQSFIPLAPLHEPHNVAGIIALSLNYGAYLSEIFRAGILGVPHGQREASLALGMRDSVIFWHVTLPQAMRTILPPVGNECIAMLKDTSLVSIMAVPDIMQRARSFVGTTYLYFETYTVVALLYLVITLMLSKTVSIMESRLNYYDGK